MKIEGGYYHGFSHDKSNDNIMHEFDDGGRYRAARLKYDTDEYGNIKYNSNFSFGFKLDRNNKPIIEEEEKEEEKNVIKNNHRKIFLVD